MLFRPWICPLLLLSAVLLPFNLEATPLHPAFDLQGPGLSVAQAGLGLEGWNGAARTLTLDVGGPVELALLYWAGRRIDRWISRVHCHYDCLSGHVGYGNVFGRTKNKRSRD